MNAKQSLYAVIRSSFDECPNAPALLYLGKEISYKTLIAQTDKLARALADYGIKPGNTVTVCLPNIPEAVYAYYAINKLGAVAHLVHPLTKAEQMRDCLKNIDTKLIFVLHSFIDGYPQLAKEKGIKIVSCNPSDSLPALKRIIYNACNKTCAESQHHIKYSTLINMDNTARVDSAPSVLQKNLKIADGASLIAQKNDCHNTAVLLHSGGTSGKPKVIELSSFAINSLSAIGTEILGVENASGKYMLSVLPMFHGFGMCMGVHAMLCHRGCNAIFPKFNRKAAIKLLSKGKLSYLIGVPILYEALLSHPKFYGKKLNNIDVAFVGGDFVAKSLLKKFNTRIAQSGGKGRLFEGYGLTETVTVCSVNTHAGNRDGSVGRTLSGLSIEAFDFSKPDIAEKTAVENTADGKEKGTEKDPLNKNLNITKREPKLLERGQCGELGISGDTLMNGYYLDDEACNNTFFMCNGKKYVRTGDYGYVDLDGYVFFKQRLKRIIKVSGISVFPSEIENIAMENDDVKNVCALDVADASHGSMVKLFVASALVGEEAEKLKARLSAEIEKRLNIYAVPKQIVVLGSLPATSVGKVDAEKLRTL